MCSLTRYFEIAKEGDGAYKSFTYYLNEARETNVLVDSRKPNIRYAHRTLRSGASDVRRFEWEVVRDIPKDTELVVEYGGAVGEEPPPIISPARAVI